MVHEKLSQTKAIFIRMTLFSLALGLFGCVLNGRVNTRSGVDAENAHTMHLWDLRDDAHQEDTAVHHDVKWLVVRSIACH